MQAQLAFEKKKNFHRHSRWLYIQQQTDTLRRPEFPGRNVVFNKTIAGRRRTLLQKKDCHIVVHV